MIISPFTPIFFEDFKSDGIESRYTQIFASTDQILFECLCADDETVNFAIEGTDDYGHEIYIPINFSQWNIGNGFVLWFTVITGLSNGIYQIFNLDSEEYSHYFRVTNEPAELAKTALIQYSMKDNKQRQDGVFVIAGMRYFFDFRVPGGFKDSGWTFAVENEQFITPEADPIELFALESTQKRFTLGGQEGVPVHFAEMLNRLLTCSYVYFDGIRYSRKDSSVPEMNVQIEGLDSFVFTQMLQKVNNLNPTIETSNHLIMRRVDNTLYRSTNNTLNRIIK